ncbi:MAG: biotin--[acetyl-CoA-carboxylase] ligase [Geminicoccaceae bacterium]|nr:biotin--[acetyl-CoA-carboxylase] ligase [Geminicoccaceae bacterium]
MPPFRIERVAETRSTNDAVRARALAGEPAGLVVRAGRQTAGRGRHGRAWSSPGGNLYASLLLRPDAPPLRAATLSLASGLALAQALRALGTPAVLKWPNDVLARGAKLAGILLEATTSPEGRIDAVVLGLGVNVASAPDLPERPATSLAALGVTTEPEALLVAFLDRLAALLPPWEEAGFAALRRSWLDHALPLGAAVTLRTGERRLEGILRDVDREGRLVLEGPDGHIGRYGAGELIAGP